MTLNEVGDFLAGSFAPLAFIWLAFAVVLQSLELSLQRRELELSRNVANESKDAIRAQAEEARRSADYFDVQTKLMEAQKDREEREEANDELPGLCVQIREAAKNAFPVITAGRSLHEYDVVREVAEHLLTLGYDLEGPAFPQDYPDFSDKFVRLRELWPVLGQSAKIHLGMFQMEEFLCYREAERNRPDGDKSETSSQSSGMGAE
ncbi:hypothetical protein ACSSV1_001215 [Labrenzia sp. MBR-25]